MADETKTNVLDLTDLFGINKQIIVRIPAFILGSEKDGEFKLLRPDAFSARQIMQFQTLQDELFSLQSVDAESMTDADAVQLEEVMRKIISFVSGSPKLPVDKLNFLQLTAVTSHYVKEVNQKKKVPMTPVNEQTGETSLQN